jgi:peptide/nickel transport system substrate-binding protein
MWSWVFHLKEEDPVLVKQRRHRFSIAALLLLVVPLIAACGGTDQTPAARSTAGGQATTAAQAPAAGEATAAGQAPAAGEATQAPAAGAATSATQAQPALPVANVTVTIPFFEQGITSFDPAYWTSQLLVSQGTILEGLYGYDQKLNVVPKIAESATPNQDNTVWTFKLRKDKKWSNGDPVTAKDFYASWMRNLSPELKDAPLWVGFAGQVKNSYAYKAGAVKAEDVGIKVLDDYTIQVTLTQPNAALINLMPVTNSMPINEKVLKAHPNDFWDPKNATYNGPFIVSKWVSGADTTLTRNPKYVGEATGNVGTVVLRPYADPNARLQAFENGEIQVTTLDDASQYQYAQNNEEMKANLKEELQNLIWQGIQFDRAVDQGPWTDQRVRQAFAMAIDKKAITDQVLKGLAVPTNAFSGDPKVTEKVKGLPYDVAKAKQLLAEAGFPNGQGFPTVPILAPPANDPRMPVVEAVAKMWQDNLGVKTAIQNNEGPVYSTLQWANYNKNIKPGYSLLGGPMNWFQPLDLLLNAGHIWWFIDYKPGGVAKTAQFDDQIAAVKDLKAPGDFAALQQRANAAWAKLQQQAGQEKNEWGENMMLAPTFKDQWDAIAKRFNEAKDDKAKLSAYQDAMTLLLTRERDNTAYDNMTDQNKEAQRGMAKLSRQKLEQAWDTVVPLQQLAVDSAWMVPIYNPKTFYVTDPKLSGIVLNKLSWGGMFQFQYLQWKE